MRMTLPKLATLAGCTALGLAGAWVGLAEGPTSAHAMKPCTALQDEVADRPCGEPLSPLEVQWPCGPLDTPETDESDESVRNDEEPTPLKPGVSYYRDGDVIYTKFVDSDEVVRRTGSYRIVVSEPQPEPAIDPVLPVDLAPDQEERLAELVDEVKCIEKCVRRVEAPSFTEESEFDAARVPPGMEVQRVRDGAWREYREDGTCASETNWRDGKQDGAFYSWHPGGTLAQSGSYIEGKAAGRWTTYSENGQMVSDIGYTNGALDGRYVQYHPNGQVASTGEYDNGNFSGEWTYYGLDGNIQRQIDRRSKIGKTVIRCKVALAGAPAEEIEEDSRD